MKKTYRIVILGRPNVGKSTLFNRLVGSRKALVHDLPGVTRDRVEEKATWYVGGKPMSVLLTDTGGLGGERFAEEIEQQVGIALEDADAAIALFDARAGATAEDRELVRKLGRAGVSKRIPLLGVVNKVDAEAHEALVSDFYALGMEEILTVSAEHGRGIDDLEEALARALGFGAGEPVVGSGPSSDPGPSSEAPEASEAAASARADEAGAPAARVPRIAIVGRPNVGKSTLANALIGRRRMITSPIAGTTVDAVDTLIELDGKPFLLIDTAGIRRKSKTERGVEVLSVVQARKALERADVALLLLDGESGTSDQDEKIGGLIEEAGASVVLIMNKWDTQRSNREFSRQAASERIRAKMAYLRYAPIMFISARQGKGFESLGDLISDILHQRTLKIPTHDLTEWVRKQATVHNPMNARFYLCHQSGRHPPTFVCHVNDPEKVHFSLRRHLVNALRERWGFMGSPVRMLFVQGKSDRRAKSAAERLRKSTRPRRRK